MAEPNVLSDVHVLRDTIVARYRDVVQGLVELEMAKGAFQEAETQNGETDNDGNQPQEQPRTMKTHQLLKKMQTPKSNQKLKQM